MDATRQATKGNGMPTIEVTFSAAYRMGQCTSGSVINRAISGLTWDQVEASPLLSAAVLGHCAGEYAGKLEAATAVALQALRAAWQDQLSQVEPESLILHGARQWALEPRKVTI